MIVESTERKKLKEEMEEKNKSLQRYLDIFNLMTVPIATVDLEGHQTSVNKRFCQLVGYKESELVGQKIPFPYWAKEDLPNINKAYNELVASGKIGKPWEMVFAQKDGTRIPVSVVSSELKDENGQLIGYSGFVNDITERKKAEGALKISESELKKQKSALEKKNIALREMLGQLEVEKKNMHKNIDANIDKLLMPILEKLKLKRIPLKYIKLLQYNLEKLTSPFGRRISEESTKLTPKEIEICNMIRSGFVSKDIANHLNLSLQTIERHRKNVRQKLGISNKKINLSSYLQNM